jgi:hypothetical protein
MAKIKTYPIKDAKDAAKLIAGVTKVLKTLGLDKYLKIKAPAKGWVEANAADGKVDVVLESNIDPKGKKGPLKCIAKAGGQTSVLGIWNTKAEEFDVTQASLKACGLIP